jgi:hypothetical protein
MLSDIKVKVIIYANCYDERYRISLFAEAANVNCLLRYIALHEKLSRYSKYNQNVINIPDKARLHQQFTAVSLGESATFRESIARPEAVFVSSRGMKRTSIRMINGICTRESNHRDPAMRTGPLSSRVLRQRRCNVSQAHSRINPR